MFTMWIHLFVCIVTVTAIKIDQSNIRDHALAQPKTDFSAFKDEHFGDSDRDRNTKSDDRRELSGPEFDQREFSEFSHRQFRHRDIGEIPGFGLLGLNFGDQYGSGDRNFRSMFSNQDFGSRGVDNSDRKGTESSFSHRSHVEKTSSGSGMKDREGSDTFDSETKIQDRNIESYNRKESGNKFHQNTGFREFTTGFQNKDFAEHFGGQQGFYSKDINRRNFENINNKFGENSNIQKTIHQIQQFTSQLNTKPETHERLEESQNQSLHNKREESEDISAKSKRKINESDRQNQNSDSPEAVKQMRREHQNHRQQNYTTVNHNIETTTNKHKSITNGPLYVQNSEDTEYDQRPKFKPTTDNEVLPKHPNRTEGRRSPDDEDRWIWSDGGGTESPPPKASTVNPKLVPEKSDLDDRTAFNGDKCPTGKKRLGSACVEAD